MSSGFWLTEFWLLSSGFWLTEFRLLSSGFWLVCRVQGNRLAIMLAMLATEIRLERHSVRVIIDTGIVLPEPRHTDDEGVRKGGDVQGNLFFVPRYADGREVVVEGT